MMWANNRSSFPALANQMQTHPPSAAPSPRLPPQQVLCVSHRKLQKSGKVNAIARRFGHEGFVPATWSNYMISRTWTKDSIPFENFKIGSLQAVISISKVCLKPENHTSKTG
jgi:hypothetical protein